MYILDVFNCIFYRHKLVEVINPFKNVYNNIMKKLINTIHCPMRVY